MHILIADDHAIVRRGLIQILEDEPDSFVVYEANDAREVLETINLKACDLIILDINLPGRSGLDVLGVIHQQHPQLPVLILSMFSEDQYAIQALKTGARGYLNKQSAPEEMIRAIRKIQAGGKYISETLAELLLSEVVSQEDRDSHNVLSNREAEILTLIARGNSLTEISLILSLSVKTISTYRARILEKLKLKNNVDLTAYALRNNLIE
ncbi:MAG: response regulator transcription factor [Chloroflexi bacterium]|jgi:two-component system invasion response regulator UvrY|nr:response regulator transcription factor [Anaerolineaceae bacterium]NMB88085.1 response regulator transcription factor [Chloroflexota bacterium]